MSGLTPANKIAKCVSGNFAARGATPAVGAAAAVAAAAAAAAPAAEPAAVAAVAAGATVGATLPAPVSRSARSGAGIASRVRTRPVPAPLAELPAAASVAPDAPLAALAPRKRAKRTVRVSGLRVWPPAWQ